MENTDGNNNLDRHFTETSYRLPTSENHGRHLYNHYPPENLTASSPRNPFMVETDLNRTLEASFSRLDLSSYPPYFPTSLGGGDMGNGSVLFGNSEYVGGEGLSQLSMLETEQSKAELRRLGVFNNGVSSSSTHGYVGIEDYYGHFPIIMGSSDILGQDSFQSGSYPSSVFREPYTINHNGLLLSDNGVRSEYWNQSYMEFPGQFLNGGIGGKIPIMQHSNRNGILGDSNIMDYSGVMGESALKKLNGLRSCLYDGRVKQQLDQISLEDLRGRIVSLAKDQYGCRFLQMKFEGIKEEEIEMIFVEVIDHMIELMLDQFGNYLIQRLVEVCNEEQRTRILLSVTKTKFQLVCICLNMHGTRSVQKLLESLTTPHQISLLMSALTPGAVALMKDINGHHVIQHCLKRFSEEDNKYLLNEVADNCFGIATDKSGCCVLQSCVEHSQGEAKERLVAEIIRNALLLAEDRYGNYVVQHLLGLKIARVTANLLRCLEGNYFSLSCNKYGSNVVEKCLIESSEELSGKIIKELLKSPNVSILLLHPFGNYVIQSALTVSKGLVHNTLVKLIEKHSSSMHSNLYGKKVLTWFDRKKLCNMYSNVQKC